MLYRFLQDEEGATAVEYALMAALIALAIIGGVGTFGERMNKLFTDTIAVAIADATGQ